MKIIRLKNNLTVILNDGSIVTHNTCEDELYNQVVANQNDDEAVKNLLTPELNKKVEEAKIKEDLLNDFSNSRHLTVIGSSVYLKDISELTIPEDLAVAIYKAEKNSDDNLLQTYLNFWTLACLNPDSRARTNLFWFLNKYGMTISSSGLFVAYRNVELKSKGSDIDQTLATFISNEYTKVKFKWKKSPKNYLVVTVDGENQLIKADEEIDFGTEWGTLQEMYVKLSDEQVAPVYTDSYTRSFTIKIGEPVTINRSSCDSKQENTCSKGLHVAGREWLSRGYFGQISLMVLVNPADVVAVPPDDNYGKMRTCAYYPVQLIERDEEGNIVDKAIEDGFEDNFIDLISYQGEGDSEDLAAYTISVPDIPEINRKSIIGRLESIKEQLKNKVDAD